MAGARRWSASPRWKRCCESRERPDPWALFEYQALDAGNKTARGVIQADTARCSPRSTARTRPYFRLIFNRFESTSKSEFSFRSQGRERALLLRQLATTAARRTDPGEGVSPYWSSKNRFQRPTARQLGAIRARVMEGQSLQSRWPNTRRCFPNSTAHRCRPVNAPGQIETVLSRLADYAEQREETATQLSAWP